MADTPQLSGEKKTLISFSDVLLKPSSPLTQIQELSPNWECAVREEPYSTVQENLMSFHFCENRVTPAWCQPRRVNNWKPAHYCTSVWKSVEYTEAKWWRHSIYVQLPIWSALPTQQLLLVWCTVQEAGPLSVQVGMSNIKSTWSPDKKKSVYYIRMQINSFVKINIQYRQLNYRRDVKDMKII